MMNREIVRTTSKLCFQKLVEEGVLPPTRRAIYEWLYEFGPATRNEISRGVEMIPNNVSTRLREMIIQGITKEVGTSKCNVTGMHVTLYDVTDCMPSGQIRKRKKPECHYVESCRECLPLQDESDDREGFCWMDLEVRMVEEGRPKDCPLLRRDFVVRAEI